MSSDHEKELFWTLLDMHKYQQLRGAVPEDFSWDGSLHPTLKTTVLIEACDFVCVEQKQGEVLDVVEWLIRSGANPSQKCATSQEFGIWKARDEHNTKLSVSYRGHSFLSWIKAWKDKFAQAKAGDWKDTIKFLDKVVDRVVQAMQQKSVRRKASVHEGIVDIWEKSLRATASHDLTIEASDSEVTAHTHMLMEASPVVRAMLGSTMREGKSQRIQLHDTGSSAVTLFLEALYTSSLLSDPDYKNALSALDLAHRWQVEVLVSMLADLVAEMITEDNFREIAEHAALKNLDTLKKACIRFGADCVKIQEQIKKRQFPKPVQDLFYHSEAAPPVKKRRSL